MKEIEAQAIVFLLQLRELRIEIEQLKEQLENSSKLSSFDFWKVFGG